MKQHRTGDVSVYDIKYDFGLKEVTLGKMPKNDQTYLLNTLYDSLYDISDLLEIEPKEIGLNGQLSIDLSGKALKNALAEYLQDTKTIVVGDTGSSFIHEYFHAMDFMTLRDKNPEFQKMLQRFRDENSTYRKDAESMASDSHYHTPTRPITVACNGNILKEPYWTSSWEMFARAGEAYLADKMKTEGKKNTFLVNGVSEEDKRFPHGEEKQILNKMFDKIIKTEFKKKRQRTPAEEIKEEYRKKHTRSSHDLER